MDFNKWPLRWQMCSVACVVWPVVMYLIGSFVAADMSIMSWSGFGRAAAVGFTLIGWFGAALIAAEAESKSGR